MRVIAVAKGSCCVKIDVRLFEISIAADDSCGAFHHMSRTNMKIFRKSDGLEFTDAFVSETKRDTDFIDCFSLVDALNWCLVNS